jgi:hypothetical protein
MGKRRRKKARRIPDREPQGVATTTTTPKMFLEEGDFFRLDFVSRESGGQVFIVDQSDFTNVVARRAIHAFGRLVGTGQPHIFRQRELRGTSVLVDAYTDHDYKHKHTHPMFVGKNNDERDACASCLHDTAVSECPVDRGNKCAYAVKEWYSQIVQRRERENERVRVAV